MKIHIEEHVPYMLAHFALLQRGTPTLYIHIPLMCKHQLIVFVQAQACSVTGVTLHKKVSVLWLAELKVCDSSSVLFQNSIRTSTLT